MARQRDIPGYIKCMLWGIAGGRCQIAGCNKPLWEGVPSRIPTNLAAVSHIVAFSERGPRGKKKLSKKLARDPQNLMLTCAEHGREIDVHPRLYTVTRLRKMKKEHERRINLATAIAPEKSSHILMYGTNVGEHNSPLTDLKAARGMFPEWYPAESKAIELSAQNSAFHDRDREFWQIEAAQLQKMYQLRVRPLLATQTIMHLSVFAIAPQPLLILLGYMLSDIADTEIYQLHREPRTWSWNEKSQGTEYFLKKPRSFKGTPALVLSLSGTVRRERITRVLGRDASIWYLTIKEPCNDYLQSRIQLAQFRKKARVLLDRIKAQHGDDAILHVFPCVPVSVAIEFGRIIMPKADLRMKIYDEQRARGGFQYALNIGGAPPKTIKAGKKKRTSQRRVKK